MQPAGDTPSPDLSGVPPTPPAAPPSPPAAPPPPPEPLEKWLWIDPFEKNDDLKKRLDSGAVLLAEDILRYIGYNLLIDKTDFDAGKSVGAKLKGASYTMTPDPDEGWMVDENNKLVKLKVTEDPSGLHFVVPRHSLVFIRLKQRLRVPYYMIGRHNLKIRYVYQGLLLGTGPQVDPGFVGKLYIPLHNFTTSDVNVYLNDSFVSIDFARTPPLCFDKGVPETLDDLYEKYESTKWLFDRKKLQGRARLTDYLDGKTPQSAMVGLLGKYREALEQLTEVRNEAKNINSSTQGRIDGFKNDLENMQQKLDVRANAVDTRLDTSHTWHRIEVVVVAGIIAAAVIAIVALNHQTNEETRLIMSENFSDQMQDIENKMITSQNSLKNYQTYLSNSLSSISTLQNLVTSNQFEIDHRLSVVEKISQGSSKRIAEGIVTNAAPKLEH